MPCQSLENPFWVRKLVCAQSRLVRDVISDVLSMFACDERVIQNVMVEGLCGILKVKLNQFDSIREAINWDFDALSDCNPLIITSFKDS